MPDVDPLASKRYEHTSPALAEGETAMWENPAAVVSPELNLLYTYSGQPGLYAVSHTFNIALPGLGGGVSWLYPDSDTLVLRYATAHSLFTMADIISLGSGYRWTSSASPQYNGLFAWDLGLRIRAYPHVSFGLVWNNIIGYDFSGEYSPPSLTGGLAVRPLPEPLSRFWEIYSDVYFPVVGNGIDLLEFSAGVRIRPGYDGLTLAFSYHNIRQFSAQVMLNLEPFPFIGGTNNLTMGYQQNVSVDTRQAGKKLDLHFSSHRRKSFLPLPFFVSLPIGGRILDSPPVRGGLFDSGPQGTYIYRLIQRIHRLASDPQVQGVIIKMRPLSCGLSQAIEIRHALKKLEKKTVIVHLSQGGNIEYFLATAADYVYAAPAGFLNLVGLSLESLYYKDLLENIKIRGQFFAAGKYKGAMEPAQRTEMSPEQREANNAVLDGFYDYFIDTMAVDTQTNMHLNAEALKTLVDGGPYTPDQAEKMDLIHGKMHYDTLIHRLKRQGIKNTVVKRAVLHRKAGDYFAPREKKYWGMAPAIAVINVDGNIVTGGSLNSPFAQAVGADSVKRLLKTVRKNILIRAVVLRINSGGGSVLASDMIHEEIRLLKKAKKKVVVSMSNTAASGGYYIAANADKILATEGTITGSIGVIIGKYDMSGLLTFVGVNREVLKRGENADFFTPFSAFTEKQAEKIRSQLKGYYRKFKDKVRFGREMDEDAVEKAAQGRIWTGPQAKKLKLVDEVGGLVKAISAAKAMSGIAANERVLLVSFNILGTTDTIFVDTVTQTARYILAQTGFSSRVLPDFAREQLDRVKLYKRLSDEKILYLLPKKVTVK